MRRMWVLIASLLACVIITATPAMAQAAQPAQSAAATTAALVQGPAGVAVAAPMNWFSDWQTCIWGIGTPTALAWRFPAKAKQIAAMVLRSRDRGGLVRAYGHHTISACERFLRS